MSKHDSLEKWKQDIDLRQRNTVYPDTLSNEVRFWRNLGSQKLNTTQKIGLATLAIFAGGFLATYLIAVTEAGETLKFVMGMIAVWVPIFAGIAWGTRRALRNIDTNKNKKHHC